MSVKTITAKSSALDNYRVLMEDIPNKIKNLMGIICDVNLLDEDGKNILK